MACKIYSMSEFKLVMQKEPNSGTAALTDGGIETALLIDIDGNVTVNEGVFRSQNVHKSTGRTAKITDAKSSAKLQENSISWTGFLDETNVGHFLENITGQAESGTTPAIFAVPYDFQSAVCFDDSDTDWTGSITFALIGPSAGDTDIFVQCIVDNLQIYFDSSTDSGRWRYDITVKSQTPIEYGADSSGWTITPYSTSQAKYITDLDAGTAPVRQIESTDVVLSSARITFASNVKFYGFSATGAPEIIGRGMPEFEVLLDLGTKYDDDTFFLKEYKASGDTIDVTIADDAWVSATLGFRALQCKIRDDFNLEDVKDGAFITLPLKVFGSTSGNLIEVVL